MLHPDISGPRRAGTATGLGVKSSAPARPHRQSSVGGCAAGIPDYQLRRKAAMLKKGFEPSRDYSHWYLKPGRLPIPPLELVSIFQVLRSVD